MPGTQGMLCLGAHWRQALVMARQCARRALTGAALGFAAMGPALAQSAAPAAPIKHIGIGVAPYYEAGESPGAPPRVKVMRALDQQLASTRPEDIEQARDLIAAHPQMITPMTLVVLAIRLYDVGLRDDAVFWFYVAKNRYITTEHVLDLTHPSLQQVREAMRAFMSLVGPFINSYAFCNPARQQEQLRKSIEWTRSKPYGALWMENIPAQPGERKARFAKALQEIEASAQEEARMLADPKAMEEFRHKRQQRQVDAQFCW